MHIAFNKEAVQAHMHMPYADVQHHGTTGYNIYSAGRLASSGV